MNEQKRTYRIQNWSAYHAALVARGSLTVWFDDAVVAGWHEAPAMSRRGAPRRHADVAIQCGLVIREVFHLSLRALTGFLGSRIGLTDVGCPGLEHLPPPGSGVDGVDRSPGEATTPPCGDRRDRTEGLR